MKIINWIRFKFGWRPFLQIHYIHNGKEVMNEVYPFSRRFTVGQDFVISRVKLIVLSERIESNNYIVEVDKPFPVSEKFIYNSFGQIKRG